MVFFMLRQLTAHSLRPLSLEAPLLFHGFSLFKCAVFGAFCWNHLVPSVRVVLILLGVGKEVLAGVKVLHRVVLGFTP
jgi:hypothetical protein